MWSSSNKTDAFLSPSSVLRQGIVELHGGRIGATSEGEGKGCTFWLELPCVTGGVTGGTDGGDNDAPAGAAVGAAFSQNSSSTVSRRPSTPRALLSAAGSGTVTPKSSLIRMVSGDRLLAGLQQALEEHVPRTTRMTRVPSVDVLQAQLTASLQQSATEDDSSSFLDTAGSFLRVSGKGQGSVGGLSATPRRPPAQSSDFSALASGLSLSGHGRDGAAGAGDGFSLTASSPALSGAVSPAVSGTATPTVASASAPHARTLSFLVCDDTQLTRKMVRNERF